MRVDIENEEGRFVRDTSSMAILAVDKTALAKHTLVKNKIKKDNPSVKDGPGLTTVCWGLYKGADNDLNKAYEKYTSMKGKFVKMVEEKTAEIAAKRAAKKSA